MNDKFDELARSMAQSVTRRGALKKFGLGLAGLALVAFGLANRAKADPKLYHCNCSGKQPYCGCDPNLPSFADCLSHCDFYCEVHHGPR